MDDASEIKAEKGKQKEYFRIKMKEENTRTAHDYQEQRKPGRKYDMLKIRNMLNLLFMLLAVVAMVGIGLSMTEKEPSQWGYVVGVLAVLVKMAEAMLRMPSSIGRPRRSKFDKRGDKQ